MSYVREGTLRVLAVMAAERSDLVPDVPTFRESGLEVVYGGFRMVVAPSGTPEQVLDALGEACRAAAHDPEFVAWAGGAGIGASWRDGPASVEYLEDLAPRVRALVTGMGPS